MNQLFDLGLSIDELCEIGVTLGADVPYCIWGGTALSEGIGEKLSRVDAMPDCYILIAKPGISVSTAFVYKNLDLPALSKHPDMRKWMTEYYRGDFMYTVQMIQHFQSIRISMEC